MRNRTRVIAAAAAVTAALAGGGTATAMASTTGAKPAAHAKTVSASYRCAPDSDLAARLGVSPARLDQALRAVKTSLSAASAEPAEGQFDAALARALQVSQARVRHAFAAEKPCEPKNGGAKSGGSKPGGSKPAPSEQQGHEALAMAVARELHISMARVDSALQPLFAAGHADPSSAVFTAAARALGVSPGQLEAALISAKESLAKSN
jgi:DNA-binding transcriptional regulator YdaS (Cro superfamily)